MSSFSTQLKRHTRPAHTLLDAHPFSALLLGAAGLMPSAYHVHLLSLRALWSGALEGLGLDPGSFWAQSLTPRLCWLNEDLEACHRDQGGPLLHRELTCVPPSSLFFPGHAAALGACYVLEGSALGGVMIAKALRAQTPPLPQGATRFYTGRGAQTMAHWQEAKKLLDDQGEDACLEEAVCAANTLFEAFAKALWLPLRG